MTVGELRKALEGLPDDMPVVGHDEGDYTTEDVVAEPIWLAQTDEGDCRLYCLKYGGIPVGPDDFGAKQYFVVT